MKSIRTKITLCLILTVLVSLVTSGTVSIKLNYSSTMSTVEQLMTETAVLAAGRAEKELEAYKNAVMEIGCIPELTDPKVPVEEKRVIIDDRVAMHDFQRGNIIGADGFSIFDGKDYSDREYVRQALQGNVYVSEPLISKITGELSIMVAAPLYEDGDHGKSVIGVVYFVPHETFLNDIVTAIQIGEDSRAYVCSLCAHGRYRWMEHCGDCAAVELSGFHERRYGRQYRGDRDRHVSIHYHSADIGNQDRQTDESLRKAYEAACGGRSGYAHAKDQEPG